jgi:penicillin-binding protein 1C
MAEARLREHLAALSHRGVRDGAVVIVDARDGAVRALVGSRDFYEPRRGQINGATLYRSAGSTLKPFLYARAIQDRLLTAAALLPDTPDAVRAEYVDYDPVNYDNRFWGPVRVREALANSLNVPAVVTLSRVGARRAYSSLEECGLHFARPFSEYGAGLILGNAEVRLLDLTAAYTLFAGHGLAVEPRLLAAAPVRHRAFSALSASVIVADILADNEARKKTFSAFSPLAFEGSRIPCKTGTSSGFRDGWTVGATAEHAVGVWVGNFDGRPMHEIAAVAGAAPIFHEIIKFLLARGDSSVPPPAGENLLQAPVCRLTGLRPVAESPGTVLEWFLAGTQPTADASQYLRSIRGQIRLCLPAEYALWCGSPLNYLGAIVGSSGALHIVFPAPNATFQIDPHLPRSQQALQLLAIGGTSEDQLWLVDGEPVLSSGHGFFWPLREGRHTVEITSGSGHVATEFVVK